MCNKKFNSVDKRKEHTKQCKIETKCKNCFKNVQISQASIAFTYIDFYAKGFNVNVHFVMMKCLLLINIKTVNVILNNVGRGNV